MTVLKELKIIRPPYADRVVNEFYKYDGWEVTDGLQKIMNMIFEREKVPSDFMKILIKPLYKKGDKSEWGNYRH
jgi:hypothetical protein